MSAIGGGWDRAGQAGIHRFRTCRHGPFTDTNKWPYRPFFMGAEGVGRTSPVHLVIKGLIIWILHLLPDENLPMTGPTFFLAAAENPPQAIDKTST